MWHESRFVFGRRFIIHQDRNKGPPSFYQTLRIIFCIMKQRRDPSSCESLIICLEYLYLQLYCLRFYDLVSSWSRKRKSQLYFFLIFACSFNVSVRNGIGVLEHFSAERTQLLEDMCSHYWLQKVDPIWCPLPGKNKELFVPIEKHCCLVSTSVS